MSKTDTFLFAFGLACLMGVFAMCAFAGRPM